MASRGTKWLVGCGAAGGAVILIVILVGYFLVRGAIREVRQVVEVQQELVERLGAPESFVPAADGDVPPDRLDRFLAVRASLLGPGDRLRDGLADFPPDEMLDGDVGARDVLRTLRSLGDLLSPIIGYLNARNRALIDQEMGLGEYLYIYSSAYYSLLGHSPGDGPVLRKGPDAGERLFEGDGEGTFDSDKTWDRYRRVMIEILGNQLAALPDADTGEAGAWRERLREEIARLRRDDRHVPWSDGLPPALAASLTPRAERLEESYRADLNCFELAPMDREEWESGSDFRLDID
ncbi:MAG: hypothetical protein JW819_10190 [Candidatus Krumholzibacteriota bacterium]|nr:hypothetical protein [Candidatus Krumholzibacteriota bacterium]